IALFGALVVCGTVVLFGVVLWVLISAASLASVDQDLRAARPNVTFLAHAAQDGSLQVERAGGLGPVPDRLPTPVRTGAYTIVAPRGDRVRVFVQARSDGTFTVTGEHLAQQERIAGVLLDYLLVTAVAAMLAGIAAIWIAARQALGPLRTMAAVAEDVGR